METSAPKRRRTSPRTAVPIYPPGEQSTHKAGNEVSPINKAPQETSNVPRPSSSVYSEESLSQALQAHLGLGQNPARNTRAARESRSPFGTTAAGILSSSRLAGIMRNPFARSPRRHHADNDDDDEELLNPLTGRPVIMSPLAEALAEEPDLPPTPEHPDPVVSTPPSGIHHTPSKRPKRSKELAGRLKSSSPLKQPAVRPSRARGLLGLASVKKLVNPRSGRPAASPQLLTTSEQRGISPADANSTDARTLNWLENHRGALQRDFDLARTENERVASARSFNRPNQRSEKPSEESVGETPTQKVRIVDLLLRNAVIKNTLVGSKRKDGSPANASPQEYTVSENSLAFLPFARPTPGAPAFFARTEEAIRLDAEQMRIHYRKPLRTHQPLKLSVERALPFLQAFTPLSCDGYLEPIETALRDIHQHDLHVSSAGPFAGLFMARVQWQVTVKTQAISNLCVHHVSQAAVEELEPFLGYVCAAPAAPYNHPSRLIGMAPDYTLTGSGVTNNVGVLVYGLSEWFRIAVRRARFWRLLHYELNIRDRDQLVDMVRQFRNHERRKAKAKAKKVKQVRRRGKLGERPEDFQVDPNAQDEELWFDLAGNDDPTAPQNSRRFREYELNMTAEQLGGYMGQKQMDFVIPCIQEDFYPANRISDGSGTLSLASTFDSDAPPKGEWDPYHTLLRLQWKIEQDWTGEAHSRIALVMRVPARYHQFDTRDRLQQVADLFDDLLEAGEPPLDAVRAVVCLLAGAPEDF